MVVCLLAFPIGPSLSNTGSMDLLFIQLIDSEAGPLKRIWTVSRLRNPQLKEVLITRGTSRNMNLKGVLINSPSKVKKVGQGTGARGALTPHRRRWVEGILWSVKG